MSENELELGDETATAINRAEQQIDHDEGVDFEQFNSEWRKKIATESSKSS